MSHPHIRRKQHCNAPIRSRECSTKKVDYKSKQRCYRQIAKAEQTGQTLYPYKCSECGGWHLTSNPKRMQPGYRQVLYIGHILTFENGLWTSNLLPDLTFLKLGDIRAAISPSRKASCE